MVTLQHEGRVISGFKTNRGHWYLQPVCKPVNTICDVLFIFRRFDFKVVLAVQVKSDRLHRYLNNKVLTFASTFKDFIMFSN